MIPRITLASKIETGKNLMILVAGPGEIPSGVFSKKELDFIRAQKNEKKREWIPFNRLDHWIIVQFIPDKKEKSTKLEECREAGDLLQGFLNDQKEKSVTLMDGGDHSLELMALAEGMALGSYQFLRYKSEKSDQHLLHEIRIFGGNISATHLNLMNAALEGVAFTRDLVNEPNSYLTAPVFAKEISKLAEIPGVRVEILNKKKLEALKMGGILGVNRGSHEPPVMIILEYSPSGALNKKPYVFVGKGIVYDTGGMNLKTGSVMNNMKNDMAGGAAVAGTVLALAKAALPVHVIGIIPATDNRPGPNAIVSGDILNMHNGMTVEVMDTDAEGRLILADALSYAKRYDPELVIDLATLTGSAVRALGKAVIAGMQSGAEKEIKILEKSGFEVFERIVELPLWDDYAETLKSDIADVKNLGGPEAGAITAGKFLEKFTSYPYIHLDIAGPAYLEKRDSYRGTGATGVGVRLLVRFVEEELSRERK
jgi:leucyl aminopeptidase